MLADPAKFLESLLNFDKENIPPTVIAKIEPYIHMESFTPEQVKYLHIKQWAAEMFHNMHLCFVVITLLVHADYRLQESPRHVHQFVCG